MIEWKPGAVIASTLRLSRPLGQGGMGVVWAARHLRLDIDVAVKLIHPERAAANPAMVKRFEREAKAAARIAHPHVVRIMDFGAVEDTVPFIVMELLDGFSLAELLERGGRLSLSTAKALARQVGSALESAHAEGIVHRDVKPHNVFITEGSRDHALFVKVLDFGVAKVLDEAELPSGSAALTETGTVVGSAPYMSPEQLEGRADVDWRSDLWSLGVIVYEALTGERPFQGGSFVAVGAAVLRGRYRPASDLRPDLPAAIDDWFAKALCVEPDGRFSSASEMVEALNAIAEPAREAAASASEPLDAALATTVEAPALEPETAAHAPAAPRPRRRSMRRRLGMAAAIASTLGAGALLAAVAQPSIRDCPPGMTRIEGKTFAMGSPEQGETPTDEMPRHQVTVDSFCLDASEVTVRAYLRCEECERPGTVELEGLTPNARDFDNRFCNGPEELDHPVNCVDWNQAERFCAALGKRLPSEQEWELAARGSEGRRYPWGSEPPRGELLNACGSECSRMLTDARARVGKGAWPAMHTDDDGAPATAPVGSYRPEGTSPPWDLAGNVWEWTSSRYCPYPKVECDDSRRVLRGGGWDTTEAADVRAARRLAAAPRSRGRSIGFRCALSL